MEITYADVTGAAVGTSTGTCSPDIGRLSQPEQ